MLSAASSTDATTLWGVSLRAAGVTVQAPPSPAVVVSVCPSTVTVTAVPTGSSVVPEIVGVVSFVARRAPPSIVTAGAVTSTVRTWVAVPVFWEASVIDATTWWTPSERARRADAPVHRRLPTVVVSVWPATVTVTGPPAGSSVVPEIGGVVSFVELVAPPSMRDDRCRQVVLGHR